MVNETVEMVNETKTYDDTGAADSDESHDEELRGGRRDAYAARTDGVRRGTHATTTERGLPGDGAAHARRSDEVRNNRKSIDPSPSSVLNLPKLETQQPASVMV